MASHGKAVKKKDSSNVDDVAVAIVNRIRKHNRKTQQQQQQQQQQLYSGKAKPAALARAKKNPQQLQQLKAKRITH